MMRSAALGVQEELMADSTDLIQGTLDMLILKSLSLEAMHGFGVTNSRRMSSTV